ncbi:hypothetical protein [Candidatus Nitrotoga sp. HW29]|uniref:hypothetical protein n=1 Tax=Candidatus Nitrotoga sp. HW29 TaxID=2886963 RepID=UPI001EF392A7|nr:hypothetical protein [Candidatus Nitrotoga sp. HW29]
MSPILGLRWQACCHGRRPACSPAAVGKVADNGPGIRTHCDRGILLLYCPCRSPRSIARHPAQTARLWSLFKVACLCISICSVPRTVPVCLTEGCCIALGEEG